MKAASMSHRPFSQCQRQAYAQADIADIPMPAKKSLIQSHVTLIFF